ncbi:MAG: CinA family protein [Thermodesulfobacteriota bacterium]
MERDGIRQAVPELAEKLKERGLTLATAESCTGGLIACELTNVSGSSDWFVGGVVAYANSVKESLLGVPGETLVAHGAVSRETVLAMASGAARALGADCALAVSGIAGPAGGTPEKPVGTVWIGWSVEGRASAERFLFTGDRLAVKRASALAAVRGLADRLA